jgi:phosphatidylserine decarboxylase
VTWDYKELNDIEIKKGEEMGRFKLGSTAIVLFGKDAIKWEESLTAETPTQMGMKFGEILSKTAK